MTLCNSAQPLLLVLIVVQAALGQDEPILLVWGEHLGRLDLQVALQVLQTVLLHHLEVRRKSVLLVRDPIVQLSATTHLHYHLSQVLQVQLISRVDKKRGTSTVIQLMLTI